MKKNTTYSDDITASFEDKISNKKANTIARDIKKLQGDFLPNNQFKENLLQRLEWVYRVDALIDTPENFSFFRVFSTVFSFVLMFAVVFIVYDTQQANIYEDTMISESEFMRSLPLWVGHNDTLWEENDMIQKTDASIEIGTNDFTPLSRDQLTSDKDISQEIHTWEDMEGISAEPQFSESIEFTIKKESSQLEQTPIQQSQVREARGWQQDSMPAAMDMQESDATNEEDFSTTCEMYKGVYNPENLSCLFPDWTICTEENIYTCAPE